MKKELPLASQFQCVAISGIAGISTIVTLSGCVFKLCELAEKAPPLTQLFAPAAGAVLTLGSVALGLIVGQYVHKSAELSALQDQEQGRPFNVLVPPHARDAKEVENPPPLEL
jgi:hypothetical protein